jgi:hypothetical protein
MKRSSTRKDDKKRTRREHNYSDDMRTLVVSLVTGRVADDADATSLPSLAATDISRFVGAPSAGTIRSWVSRDNIANVESLPVSSSSSAHDTRSVLSKEQLDVVGGFMLWRLKVRRPPHQEDVQNFILLAFREEVSAAWVSRHTHELGFVAKRVRAFAMKYQRLDIVGPAIAFLVENRPKLLSARRNRTVAAMDQLACWASGVCSVAYGLVGGCVLARKGIFRCPRFLC